MNKNWDETSISEGYTNNYTGLTVDGSVAWVTSRGITSTSSNGLFTGTTTQNNGSGASTRNQTFNIKSDGTIVGTMVTTRRMSRRMTLRALTRHGGAL